jgi:glutamine amidotransferase
MITKPAGVCIKKEYLEDAFKRNGDGAGIAIADSNRVVIIKPMWKFSSFWDVFNRWKSRPMLIHMRLATHGSKNFDNTHPHAITKSLAMAHNGVIHKAVLTGDESDTRAFIREYITPICKEHGWSGVVSEESLKKYDGIIGASKLAFMNSAGLFWYVNKSMGHEHEGCWWSNHTYKQNRTTTTTVSRPYFNETWSGDYRLAIRYCIHCRRGHQNRNVDSFQVSGEWLRKHGWNEHQYGFSADVCHGCMESEGLAITSNSWHYNVEFTPALLDSVLQYAKLKREEDKHRDKVTGGAEVYTASVHCHCCGLHLPDECHQSIYDPTISSHNVKLNFCRMCVSSAGFKKYDPVNPVRIGEKHIYWKMIVKARQNAEADYRAMHPETKPKQQMLPTVAGPSIFPDYIIKANTLFAKPPVQASETNAIAVSGKQWSPTLINGWACEMCGTPGLTVKHADGSRYCTACHEDYVDCGFNTERTMDAVAKRLGLTIGQSAIGGATLETQEIPA